MAEMGDKQETVRIGGSGIVEVLVVDGGVGVVCAVGGRGYRVMVLAVGESGGEGRGSYPVGAACEQVQFGGVDCLFTSPGRQVPVPMQAHHKAPRTYHISGYQLVPLKLARVALLAKKFNASQLGRLL
jgi:hypothetical protein